MDTNPITLLGSDGREYPAHRLSNRIIMAVAEWMDRQRLLRYETVAKEAGHSMIERTEQRTSMSMAETTMVGALHAIMYDSRAQCEALRLAIRMAAKNEGPHDARSSEEQDRQQRAGMTLERTMDLFADDVARTALTYLKASGYDPFAGADEDGEEKEGDGQEPADPIAGLMKTLTPKSMPDESPG